MKVTGEIYDLLFKAITMSIDNVDTNEKWIANTAKIAFGWD